MLHWAIPRLAKVLSQECSGTTCIKVNQTCHGRYHLLHGVTVAIIFSIRYALLPTISSPLTTVGLDVNVRIMLS